MTDTGHTISTISTDIAKTHLFCGTMTYILYWHAGKISKAEINKKDVSLTTGHHYIRHTLSQAEVSVIDTIISRMRKDHRQYGTTSVSLVYHQGHLVRTIYGTEDETLVSENTAKEATA